MPTLTELLAARRGGLPAAPSTAPVVLSARLGITSVAIPPELVLAELPSGRRPGLFSGAPVQAESELERIRALPRRTRPDEAALIALQQKWNALLRHTAPGQCGGRCVATWGNCIDSLNFEQAWGLEEFSTTGGVVARLGVGAGKTGLDILLPFARPTPASVVVLLLKSSLIDQFVSVDYPQWSAHFRTPNLDARYAATNTPGRPTIYIYSYSDLSSPKNTKLLRELKPDLIIGDEVQNLANPKTSRTGRFLRYFTGVGKPGDENYQPPREECSYAAGSGSLQTKSILQSSHHYALALRAASPLPIHPEVAKRWAKAVDPTPTDHMQHPIGALRVFCKTGEDAATGLGRRVNETAGVIYSDRSSCDQPLYLRTRIAPAWPEAGITIESDEGTYTKTLKEWMAWTRLKGKRPDGEEPKTAFDKPKWLRQMACGFYYHYRFPHGEPEDLIKRWFAARAAFHKELRVTLESNEDDELSSPFLLTNAAHRYYFPPARRNGAQLPIWASVTYRDWLAVKDLVRPVEGLRWLSDYLLNDALDWAAERKAEGQGGIIWCEFTELGNRIAAKLGVDYYNGGDDNNVALRKAAADKVVVCSIKAHKEGFNLQKYNRALVTSNPADAGVWEQMTGRIFRQGQLREVTQEVYRHSEELRSALDKAIERAEWLEKYERSKQIICQAKRDF